MTSPDAVAIVGTGRMAGGIARAFLGAGWEVRLVSRTPSRAGDLVATLDGNVTAHALHPDAIGGARLVIETVIEDAAAKRAVLAAAGRWLDDHAVIVTNTSSIPISDLADAVPDPARFAGMHFMNPADASPLVEIVRGPATSDDTLEDLASIVRTLGKRPLQVAVDVPGFVWNRLQFAILREALWLLEHGVADVETIDAAVSDALAPRWMAGGPFVTADLGGLDTFRRIADHLFPELSNETRAPRTLARLADSGGEFHAWTDDARESIVELRGDAIEAGTVFAARRRGAGLEPDTDGV